MNNAESNIPRPEYPRPQLERNVWRNLNGEWTYTFDHGRSGMQRGFYKSTGFENKILVPFCPESALSGVHSKDFIQAMWYHRKLLIAPEWREQRIILHFGAVDYEAEIFIDGKSAGHHWGGSSSFSYDITALVSPGKLHDLTVYVQDDIRSGHQPSGKQSSEYWSSGCFYTRVTGIWQTVWIEPVSPYSIEHLAIVPDFDHACFHVRPVFRHIKGGYSFHVRLLEQGKICAEISRQIANSTTSTLQIPNPRSWSPENPFLYDLELDVRSPDGQIVDSVKSYAGLRKVHCEGNKIFINNEPCYLRFILDQGYYENGIWTAPSDEDLKHDIQLSLQAGFNGARLHQKIFEERFHYWADKIGYLTWGESPSWGLDYKSEAGSRNFLSEWREIVVRSINHPSIIAWTTLNETWDISSRKQHRRLHIEAYDLTRDLDPSRPINNASGGCHVKTDLYTVHIYEQDPEILAQKLTPDKLGGVFQTLGDKEAKYDGQPYIIDEFGGIKWISEATRQELGSWGYGEMPRTLEELYTRLEGQIDAIVGLSHAAGYCYTQLTDVEQEQNGLYHYDRSTKFDLELLRKIFGKVPKDYQNNK